MIGDMQKWTPNVAGIIEHAKKVHPKTEIIHWNHYNSNILFRNYNFTIL